MIQLNFINSINLNVSLQVGDLIYASSTSQQAGAKDQEQDSTGAYASINEQGMVGILRRVDISSDNIVLQVDETAINNPYTPTSGDFIMFSKYDQSMGDVIGYYAKARFTNDSKEKAEIFSVGSEVTINSK